jgi:hypothetical protein
MATETVVTPPAATDQAAQAAAKAASDAAFAAAAKSVTDESGAKAAAEKAAAEKAASDKAALDKVAADKAATDKLAADKAASDATAAAAAKANEYKLTLPKDAKLESSELEKFTAKMKEYGVTPQQAQRLLESGLADRKAADEALAKQRSEIDSAWQKQLETEYGQKFGEANEHAKRGFDVIDPDSKIRKGMEAAGLKNWPEVFRGMERLGRMVANDRLHAPGTAGADNSKLSPEERIAAQYRKAAGKT